MLPSELGGNRSGHIADEVMPHFTLAQREFTKEELLSTLSEEKMEGEGVYVIVVLHRLTNVNRLPYVMSPIRRTT